MSLEMAISKIELKLSSKKNKLNISGIISHLSLTEILDSDFYLSLISLTQFYKRTTFYSDTISILKLVPF